MAAVVISCSVNSVTFFILLNAQSLEYLLVIGDINCYAFVHQVSISTEVSVVLKSIGLAVLLVSFAGVSSARQPQPHFFCQPDTQFGQHDNACGVSTGGPPPAAPEIDPASAMAGFTLLLGSLAVFRGRRARNSAV
jgi:hypothetical protein